MARGWIIYHQLSSSCWLNAIKRETEISNHITIIRDKIVTSPHELAYKEKYDLRVLLPIFSVSCIIKLTDSKVHRLSSVESHSIRAILLGRAPQSNCYYLYHPTTKIIVYYDDFKLDETRFAGPTFNLSYEEVIYLKSYDLMNDYLSPPKFPPESTVYLQSTSPEIKSTVIQITYGKNNIYTIRLSNNDIRQVKSTELCKHNPDSDPTSPENNPAPIPDWIKHDSKCTLFLDAMSSPKNGKLIFNDTTKTWNFRPGKNPQNPITSLPNLEQNISMYLSTYKLFQGHIRYDRSK